METFEQRLDEIIYRTAVIKAQTQSLLKDLLSKLDEDVLKGCWVSGYERIIRIHTGSLLCEVCFDSGDDTREVALEDLSQQDKLDLIKYIIKNKLHEKTV